MLLTKTAAQLYPSHPPLSQLLQRNAAGPFLTMKHSAHSYKAFNVNFGSCSDLVQKVLDLVGGYDAGDRQSIAFAERTA